jgi:hypothetical protein
MLHLMEVALGKILLTICQFGLVQTTIEPRDPSRILC